MKRHHEIDFFLILGSKSVSQALNYYEANPQINCLVVVDVYQRLLGTLTLNDVRNSLSNGKEPSTSIADVCNTECSFISSTSNEVNYDILGEHVLIPEVLDLNHRRVTAIWLRGSSESIYISGKEVSPTSSVFTIAEIGNNHNGSVEDAKRLCDLAAEADFDAVKLQFRDIESCYNLQAIKGESELSVEYTLNHITKFQLSKEDIEKVLMYAKTLGLKSLCTPWDLSSLDVCVKSEVDAIKISSADHNNISLIEASVDTGLPLILSTGMSTERDIKQLVYNLELMQASYSLLHCVSLYPTPLELTNIKYIQRLSELTTKPVGYSSHDIGVLTSCFAVGQGAAIIEKHVTLDKNQEGNDHRVSLEPHQFKEFINSLKQTKEILNSDISKASLSQAVIMNLTTLGKSLYFTKDLKKGSILSSGNLIAKSPAIGLPPTTLNNVVGKKLLKDIRQDELLCEDHFLINEIDFDHRRINFKNEWGLPVRYRDVDEILDTFSPNFVEFHMSLLDTRKSIPLRKKYNCLFSVHSPELMDDDSLLDIANGNKTIRENSIDFLKNIIDITNKIKPYFDNCIPEIIINCGGFGHKLSNEEKKRSLNLCIESLLNVSNWSKGSVKLRPQSMPPYPWHFGGRSYHNLFVDLKDFKDLYDAIGIKGCLDLSHTSLMCSTFELSLESSLEQYSSYFDYFHIADSKDVDQEGLTVGEGIIDFERIYYILSKFTPGFKYIPEVWQGHLHNYKGFKQSLLALEKFGW